VFDDQEVYRGYFARKVARRLRKHLTFDEVRQQPYHVEVWSEKTLPVGRRIRETLNALGVTVLVEGEGDLSYGLAADFVRRINDAEKPAVIYYLSDFDAKGHAMPEKMASKISWLEHRGDLDETVYLEPLALTQEQVERHDFPRSPIEGSDKTGSGAKAYDSLVDNWEERMGEGAVEINVFETRPKLFERILQESISLVIDDDLNEKTREAKDKWEETVEEVARDVVDDVPAEDLQEWCDEFNEELKKAREHIERMNELNEEGAYAEWRSQVRDMVEEIDVPEAEPPEGEAPPPDDPLFDSSKDYAENLKRVKEHQRGER